MILPLNAGWTNGEGNTNLGNPGLPFTYYNNFAYLSQTGLPLSAGGTTTFPILVGEFGTVFDSLQNATNFQPNTIFVRPLSSHHLSCSSINIIPNALNSVVIPDRSCLLHSTDTSQIFID